MRLRDRVREGFRGMLGRRPTLTSPNLAETMGEPLLDLPLRREAADERTQEALSLAPAAGIIDSDEYGFRRLSSGIKFKKRDLTPLQQDRALEISWYLFESNPFARRLITAMTDIVVGEGVGFDANDPKIQEAGDKVWNHPINKLGERARELHDALSLNGELILPVGLNDISGVPTIGFIDPYQVERIIMRDDNVLVPDLIRLKRSPGEADATDLKVIQFNPLSGLLEGDAFYIGINKLPNSSRGRPDYLPLADWLDLFDQYLFAEVERVRLLSAFVWDLEVKDANADQIRARLKEIGTPQSGSMFGRNQNEKLTALAPQLNATDRSETAKLLTIHIAGSLGMPISWFGWSDTNRATMEGQNDVAMKTPAARQKVFGAFLNLIVRYGIERQRAANPVLFRDIADDKYSVAMPEIAAKDLTRAATALAQAVAAMDTAMQNRTMSRRVATIIELAITKHLASGHDFTAEEVMNEADADAEERQAHQDDLMAQMAKVAGAAGPRPVGPGGRPNPPIPPRSQTEAAASVADLPVL